MGIVGEDNEGNIYRLRDADFDLVGASTLSVSTEDAADPVDELSVTVPAGDYSVTLVDGWRLERFDAATQITLDVDAFLNSANPVATDVSIGVSTPLTFQFIVADAGPVTLGEGTLDIDIDVDTTLVSCEPLLQDCQTEQGCYPIGNPGAFEFVCIRSFGATPEQACDLVNECGAGLLCASDPRCGAAATCCLEICETGAGCDGAETCQPFDASVPGIGFCGA